MISLSYRGRSTLGLELAKRQDLLAGVLDGAGDDIQLLESYEVNPAELLDAVKKLGFEGIVAKQKDSIYEPGNRSRAWLKYKINKGQEFVIGGYTPGNPFDAIIVGYYEDGKLFFAGKVRNGFVPHVRRDVMARMKPLETDVCPFANLPEKQRRTQWALTREQMKDCVWLEPKLVAQIEFTEWTPGRPSASRVVRGASPGQERARGGAPIGINADVNCQEQGFSDVCEPAAVSRAAAETEQQAFVTFQDLLVPNLVQPDALENY